MIPFLDSLKSLVTGLGTSKDKTVDMAYAMRFVDPAELNAMYRSDWLSRKIVDIIPNDMTREWRDWQAKGPQIEAIEEVEAAPLINVRAKVNLAMRKARLHGGAAIYLGMKDRTPAEPLDLDRVKKGDLLYLHVLNKAEATPGTIIRDVTSEYYGEPESYSMTGRNGSMVTVHPSRMIRFVGADVLDDQMQAYDGWGDSVLQVVYDAIQNATSASQHVAALIPEAKTDVVYVPQLSEFLRDAGTTRRLTDRFTYANTIKSMFNMILLEGDGKDAGEKWEQKQINFAHLPELIQQYLQIASGAADIPVTRLLGQSPSGLNSTGDGDIKNYYDNVSARQKTELQPQIARIDEVIIRSALGVRPRDIYFTWAPLYTMSEKEQAETFKMKADAARAIAGGSGQMPIVPIEALSDAFVNMLVEDGSMPGLQAAIDEYGRLSEQSDDDGELAAASLPRAGEKVEENEDEG